MLTAFLNKPESYKYFIFAF